MIYRGGAEDAETKNFFISSSVISAPLR